MNKDNQPQTSQEPRQFWIYGFNTGRVQVSETEVSFDSEFFSYGDSRPLRPQFVYKVVEFSAYQSLQQKVAELEAEKKKYREALHGLNNECAAMLSAHGDVILRDYGNTNLECLEFRLEKARQALNGEEK